MSKKGISLAEATNFISKNMKKLSMAELEKMAELQAEGQAESINGQVPYADEVSNETSSVVTSDPEITKIEKQIKAAEKRKRVRKKTDTANNTNVYYNAVVPVSFKTEIGNIKTNALGVYVTNYSINIVYSSESPIIISPAIGKRLLIQYDDNWYSVFFPGTSFTVPELRITVISFILAGMHDDNTNDTETYEEYNEYDEIC